MQKNIDQQFQEAISQLEGVPMGISRDPQANWESIDAQLNEDRRRRRKAWLWVAAAASVAILIGFGWYLLPDTGKEKVQPIAMLQPVVVDSASGSSQAQPNVLDDRKLPLKDDLESKGGVVLAQSQTGTQLSAVSNFERQAPVGNAKVTLNDQNRFKNSGGAADHWTSNGAFTNPAPSPTTTTTYARSTNGLVNGQQQQSVQNGTFAWGLGKSPQQPALGTYKVDVTDANKCCSGKKNPNGQSFDKPVLGFFVPIGDSVSIGDPYGGETYAETVENAYFATTKEPLSTFSIDVDRASYTNHRRYVEAGQLPPKYSVRAEEFINYFDYQYPQPHGNVPFSILPEVTTCPWNPRHQLVRIALKGREVSTENVPPSNIVFLLDVSGSMGDADKLPLLKQALGMLTEKLREQDKVSIVVYAGAAGLVLPPTSGSNKQAIMGALNRLEAGGSTAGGQGIELAYATARQNYIRGGNNRVILATDGDFNVGTSDETGLEKLIVKKREEGVFLSVLGFGEGNLQDSKMELLADKGNGNYNYIDSDREAHKVLVSEFGGTLYTIAKDVKIQVEFNPLKVESYRLVGYENRKLRNEDFANDKIDAGELGAGHTVTALYEIVPAGSGFESQSQDLKYQAYVPSLAAGGKEVLTVKLRYKDPDGSVSKLLEEVLVDDGRNIAETTEDFRWAVAVAEYALILRDSDYKGLASYEQVLSLARSAMGRDKEGLRKEFVELVTKAAATTQVARKN